MLGVAFYGRSFTLESPANAEPGAKAIGPGIAGPITNKPGLLAFNEVCQFSMLKLGKPLGDGRQLTFAFFFPFLTLALRSISRPPGSET